MDGTFNGQILVDKLTKLNNSQQCIETLSHWCIFHRKKAKQVVETWSRQFYCAPRDQHVSFLYLANDILQNSRRMGLEFVNEFWIVLPAVLHDVVDDGDEFGRKAALRLVNIWDERKVFGSRGSVLKEELLRRNVEGQSRNGNINYNLKPPVGDMLAKLFSCYQHIHNESMDENAVFGKCQAAITCVEKLEKETRSNLSSGKLGGSGIMQELQEQCGVLSESIELLKAAESSRATLLVHLREALHEQEFKIQRIRGQLQLAQMRYDLAGNICQHLQSSSSNNRHFPPEQQMDETLRACSDVPPGFVPESNTGDEGGEQLTQVTTAQQQQTLAANPHQNEDERQKTATAPVRDNLTTSTSSTQVLSYASAGVINQIVNEDYPSHKKHKFGHGVSTCIPTHPQPLQPLPLPHHDTAEKSSPPLLLPPPCTTPPPLPFSATSGSFTYCLVPLQRPLQMPSYSITSSPPDLAPPNPFHGFPLSETVGLFNLPPVPAVPPPVSRQ